MEATRLPADWPERYAAWREDALPLIRAGQKGPYETYPRLEFETPHLQPLATPLRRARIGLVSSGGLSLPGQPPFDGTDPEGDPGMRIIAGEGPLPTWQIEHGHYDPAAAREDYNVVFPLDALRTLAAAGEIGQVAPRQISFVGYQTDAVRLLDQMLPQMLDVLRGDRVDAALLVPV